MPSAPCTTVTRRSAKARRCRCSNASGSNRTTSRNSQTWSCFGVRVCAASMAWSSMAARVAASVTRRATRSMTRICSASTSPRRNASQTVGRPVGESAGAGEQAAHLVGLITQQQRQLVGHKLTRLRPFQLAHIRNGCISGFFGDPRIGVAHRRLGQPSRGRCGLPAGIRHRLPRRGAVVTRWSSSWSSPVMDSSSQPPLTLFERLSEGPRRDEMNRRPSSCSGPSPTESGRIADALRRSHLLLDPVSVRSRLLRRRKQHTIVRANFSDLESG